MAKNNISESFDAYSGVIAQITADAIEKVDGIKLTAQSSGRKEKSRHVMVAFLKDNKVNIDIYANVSLGAVVPEVVGAAQETIIAEVEKATKYKVSAVNVHVVSVNME